MAEAKQPIEYITTYNGIAGYQAYKTAVIDFSTGLLPVRQTPQHKEACAYYETHLYAKTCAVIPLVKEVVPAKHWLQKDKYSAVYNAIIHDITHAIITTIHCAPNTYQEVFGTAIKDYVTGYITDISKKELQTYIKTQNWQSLESAPASFISPLPRSEKWDNHYGLCKHPRHAQLRSSLFQGLSGLYIQSRRSHDVTAQWILDIPSLIGHASHFLASPTEAFNVSDAWQDKFKSDDMTRRTVQLQPAAPITFITSFSDTPTTGVSFNTTLHTFASQSGYNALPTAHHTAAAPSTPPRTENSAATSPSGGAAKQLLQRREKVKDFSQISPQLSPNAAPSTPPGVENTVTTSPSGGAVKHLLQRRGNVKDFSQTFSPPKPTADDNSAITPQTTWQGQIETQPASPQDALYK